MKPLHSNLDDREVLTEFQNVGAPLLLPEARSYKRPSCELITSVGRLLGTSKVAVLKRQGLLRSCTGCRGVVLTAEGRRFLGLPEYGS